MGLFRKKGDSSKLIKFIAHRNNGALLKRHERWKEAIFAYQQAISIKPNDAKAHYDLGMTYVMNQDKGSAVTEYKILKKLDIVLAEKLLTTINAEWYDHF